MKSLDSTEFRNALGQFATGVTVITSVDKDGLPVGVTASSFNSVSLEPPLVLWSLAKNSGSLPAFQESGYFCVHVLAEHHEAMSQRFASRGEDKFADVEWESGLGSVPLLPEYAAQFQCKTTYQYEGGDHVIFVGEVHEYDTRDEKPLVFHKGRYAIAKEKGRGQPAGDAVDVATGTFSDNFFLYLLSRAHYQASYDLNRELVQEELSNSQYLSLTLMGLVGDMSFQDLHSHLDHTGDAPQFIDIQRMLDRGLVTETTDGSRFSLTVKGRSLYIRLLALSKATEKRLLANFSEEEVGDVRDFLQRFIDASDSGAPSLWSHKGGHHGAG